MNVHNPFKHRGDMLPVASLNSLYVDEVTAYDLFRPTLILEELRLNKELLQLDDLDETPSLHAIFSELFASENESVRRLATEIAIKYGHRLALILATLFDPSDVSQAKRQNWTQKHWDYWKTIRHLYLVGGLTSPNLTGLFYDQVASVFSSRGIDNVDITFIDGSQHLGLNGLASLIEDGDSLLFDFGQTSIKRSRHRKRTGAVVIDAVLEPRSSRHLFYKSASEEELLETAKRLDDYIVKTIVDTAHEVSFTGTDIRISMANYVSDGVIYASRGGYGKLAYLSPNYREHLQNRLVREFGREMSVHLYHDTSAMAYLFRKEPHCAVISMGTAFGVAFPDES